MNDKVRKKCLNLIKRNKRMTTEQVLRKCETQCKQKNYYTKKKISSILRSTKEIGYNNGYWYIK